jgi:hypothetical protein
MRPVRLRVGLVATLAVLGVALAACAGQHGSGVATANGGKNSKAKPSASASVDPAEKALKFAECMRAHGVDIKVATETGGGVTVQGSAGPGAGAPDRAKLEAAQEACRVFAPNGGDIPKPNAQQLEQERKFAVCMRAHGIDIPDPDPNRGGITVQESGGPRMDPSSPKFKAAQEACRNLLPPPMSHQVAGGGR